MNQYYDLTKKGTVILSAGRAGSHLMGDTISTHIKNITPVTNFGEIFFPGGVPLCTSDFLKKVDSLSSQSNYAVLQVQDFTNQLQILRFNTSWLEQYHVVCLTRSNLIKHFFGLQILRNFHSILPTHTINGIPGSFDALKGKKITVSKDTVYQFFAHNEILKLFNSDVEVSYENFIKTPDIMLSKYQKNQYPIGPEDLFENYNELVDWLYGRD
jgi:hypothetical protein